MTRRRSLSKLERVKMLARQGYKCARCKSRIDGTGTTCIAEHWVTVESGNDQKPDYLLCKPCAHLKTFGSKATSYGSDVHARAKVKRLRGETRQGPKKKIPARANPWPPKGSRKLPGRKMERRT